MARYLRDRTLVEGSDWSETGTLRDVLGSVGTLRTDKAVAIVAGLARGLDAVHRECVVHRALSPDNVLMVNETPKLMNFDLSFQLEENRVTVIPDATKLKRSPYIAPEIYVGGVVPEATADLFSLGIILYEMLAGKPPFGCSTDLERSNGVLTDEHRQELQRRGVGARIVDLVFDLVCQDQDARTADARLVLERLEGESQTVPAVHEVNPRLPAGAQSGLYNIEQFVRCGAEAQIYRAAGARGRGVALKLFNHDVALQRVVEEQRFAAETHHPALVRVDTYSQWSDGRYFIAFDWISERSLRDEITEGARPDMERFVRGAVQLLDALATLHQNTDNGLPCPILHNDIKPENILLEEGDRLVLVDFGAASDPHVGTYEGTEGFVAPDLRLGQDRKYSEDGDLFALSVSLHEWLLGFRPGQEEGASGSPRRAILDWLRKGSATEANERFASASAMREALTEAVAGRQPSPIPSTEEVPAEAPELSEPAPHEPEHLWVLPEGKFDPNPFVPYLNSLHSRGAGTENALAEAQALNPLFGHIHVPNPLVDVIGPVLFGPDRKHVILTGHAGDGKSTIALELFKQLVGVPLDQPLAQPLNRREDITSDGKAFSLVKDLSEWSPEERDTLMAELLNTAGPRFFLISNTGTLIDAFKAQHKSAMHADWARVESDLLGAMNIAGSSEMEFQETLFVLINVAMIDNLGIAMQIFQHMLSLERWKDCDSADCRRDCPIYRNVSLIQENMSIVCDRLFLAYRRLYEYGIRLTLRQLCAHLAYMITSGLNYPEIVKMSQRAKPPLMAEFMFFNRFFGDNGGEVDGPGLQIRAIGAVREQGFGSQPSPTWERKLWLRSRGEAFQLAAAKSPDDFDALQSIGSGQKFAEAISGEEAREQVRRSVFFLHDFGPTDDGSFLKGFLKSVMLLDFARWQAQEDETLGLQETSSLHRRIMHVLKEHFTGVRLPEGSSSDRHLFVTLSRRSHDIRQSAQVVLARYPEDDFQIRLRTVENGSAGIRRELVLEGKAHHGDLTLHLTLPFLDYVMMRNQGEIGRALQASYVDRLERFKGQLIRRSAAERGDDIMLVELNRYAVGGGAFQAVVDPEESR